MKAPRRDSQAWDPESCQDADPHKGGAVAVFATARQLAEHVYRMLRHGHDYVDIGEQAYDDKFQARRLAALTENARALGFTLIKDPALVAT
ncbi:MAG: hypothetical protein AB7O24_12705 [Kofleriaceae bacterium]